MAGGNQSESRVRDLTDALAAIRSRAEAGDFLRAILTPRELEKIALRWRLVRMLHEGWSQRHIAGELGVSLCKITRGSKELKYGPPGFRRLVGRAFGGAGRRGTERKRVK